MNTTFYPPAIMETRKYARQGTEYKRRRNRGLETEEKRTGTVDHCRATEMGHWDS
jgi:hypothetical protein